MNTDMITSISYSTNNGETWTTTNNTNNKSGHLVITVNVNEGDKVLWKGNATQLGFYDNDEMVNDTAGSFFSSTCEFDAQGNVMSLLYGDNFKGETTIENDYTFAYLFFDYNEEKTCEIVNAKNLSLPATTLAYHCYYNMFESCTSLTTAPSILPAMTLAESCYESMFHGCTSLTTTPALPATTLAVSCYQWMFENCTSLTTAPELPATTLAEKCYNWMFHDCTSLNYIKAMFTTTPDSSASTSCTYLWVSGVASNGTFIKNAAATWTDVGTYAVPTGWTVQTASN